LLAAVDLPEPADSLVAVSTEAAAEAVKRSLGIRQSVLIGMPTMSTDSCIQIPKSYMAGIEHGGGFELVFPDSCYRKALGLGQLELGWVRAITMAALLKRGWRREHLLGSAGG